MRWCVATLLAAALAVGCRTDGESTWDDEPADLPYFCEQWTAAWCPALVDCDPFLFGRSFRSFEECLVQVEEDCLEPPEGVSPCDGATPSETDDCVDYLESHHPDGCESLFGPLADTSRCDAICD